MGDAPDDGLPIGAPIGVHDPDAAAACKAAQDARYAECRAAGMSDRAARLEAVGAAAEKRREQLGLPAKPPDDALYEQLQAERRAAKRRRKST